MDCYRLWARIGVQTYLLYRCFLEPESEKSIQRIIQPYSIFRDSLLLDDYGRFRMTEKKINQTTINKERNG